MVVGITYLHQLAAATASARYIGYETVVAYLGENVVREKEYRSAILGLVRCL